MQDSCVLRLNMLFLPSTRSVFIRILFGAKASKEIKEAAIGMYVHLLLKILCAAVDDASCEKDMIYLCMPEARMRL